MQAIVIILCVLAILPRGAMAEAGSLFAGATFSAGRGGLFAARVPDDRSGSALQPSLFVGRMESGLFGDLPASEPAFADAPLSGMTGSDVVHIRNLIGHAESRRDGYDAVQYGARLRPAKRPTQMTLAEIHDWIDATPGQPHAIGRYQFIPATLRRVTQRLDVRPDVVFSPALQDRLADVLLAEAGLHRFRAGRLGRADFMNNLAKIWAGLPNSSGKSHYHGYAGNQASMTWARFDAEMATISPG